MRHTKSIDDAMIYMMSSHRIRKPTSFVRPHVNEKWAFSKISTLESIFEKFRFWGPFFTWYVWTIGQIGKKIRFQTKPLGINRSSSCHCSLGDTVLLSDETNFLALFCVTKSGFLPHFQSVWEFNFSLTWLPVSCPLRPRASSANFNKLSFSS